MSFGLIELEKTSEAEKQMEIIETVFREAHSLKGAARSVNIAEIETVCQSLESVFASLKRKGIALSPELFNILHEAVDSLNNLLLSTGAVRTDSEKSLIKELTQRIEGASRVSSSLTEDSRSTKSEAQRSKLETHPLKSEIPIAEPRLQTPMMTDTVRIAISKLDSIMLQAEELLSTKLSSHQLSIELQEIKNGLVKWDKEWAKEVSGLKSQLSSFSKQNPKLSSIHPQFNEFLDWNDNYIKTFHNRLTALQKTADHDHRSLSLMVDNLLDDMKKVLMFPFSSLLQIFPKLVRDLSHEQGKDIEMLIHGGDIEIDRRILEEMKDPLIHLARNCIDHGIEKPEERSRRQKALSGTIKIAISHTNSKKVEILISDDGAGIDFAKIKSSAVRLGLIPKEDADKLDEPKALSLIFQSGVTASLIITDISGRGLGLAIVREKVEKLGGSISCETKTGAGTTFRIVLPLTLATYRGILVRLNEHLFVLPTVNMDSVKRIKRDEIKTIENRETILLDGSAVSLVPLSAVLELPQKEKKDESREFIQAVVLSAADKCIAFSVDEVLNEQEVLVKSLGNQLTRVRNIAGATILGSGKVVPILNIPDLMKSAVRISAAPAVSAVVAPEEIRERKYVLVVEDSITARTLLKNILETAGFNVKTTVDGIDAFTALKTEDFDLVVSDIDMPRMNGFDLTAKIRGDKKFVDLPVVLVTALESREDRERGIDVGANAYIVKSSFDQSNLLEIIKRLI
ncbi:MAG: hybrid sensor histidine kinase/response regulator [Nanoarchaeota archaeon]|nr:MAG: hybrid sensor histidine kinase/response regulator [Nanoarchaeota archaeon]